jgi:DNA-binding transcriptional MerR regulator
MIRIGDFARMAGVSVATLRLYDEQGLLEPVQVDSESGYRFYQSSQLVLLHRISVLKELGFTLREISSIIREGVKPDGMSELLAEKRRMAESQLQKERQKIKRLELQIQIIKGLQKMTIADVQTFTVSEKTVAAIHLVIPTNDQAEEILGSAYGRLFSTLSRQGVEAQGPCLAIWATSPDTVTEEVVDAAVPVGPGLLEEGDIALVTLPRVDVASVTHRGPFCDFQTCHIVLKEWLAANRCRLSGPYREIYHSAPCEDAVTEVQYPIAPV